MKQKNIIFILIVAIVITCSSLSVCFAEENITDDILELSTNDEPIIQQTNVSQDLLEQSSTVEVISQRDNQTELSATADEQVLTVSDTSSYQGIYDTCTVKDRTFKLGKYSVTISKTRFANLYAARDVEDYYWSQGGPDTFEWGDKIGDFNVASEGVYYEFEVPTNKYVKQKIGIGYKGDKLTKMKTFKSKNKAKKYKKSLKNKYYMKIKKKNGKYVVYKVTPKYKKIVTKKARVYIMFNYGPSQCGPGNYKYSISLNTKYQNPGYDIVKGWLSKYRVSSKFSGLKTAKVRS